MIIEEMHYDFKVKIDKVDSLVRDDFNVVEIDWLLNEAQEVFVKQRYGGNNPHRTGFEETQKRIEDLANLVIRWPEQIGVSATATSDADIKEVEINAVTLLYDPLFILRTFANVVDPVCGTTIVSLRPMQLDDLNYGLKDPFNKPSADNGYLYTLGKNTDGDVGEYSMFIHIPTGATITDVRVEYLKKPKQMSSGGYTYIDNTVYAQTDCELSPHTHREIVDIAVDIAAGIIEHPTYARLKEQKVFKHE